MEQPKNNLPSTDEYEYILLMVSNFGKNLDAEITVNLVSYVVLAGLTSTICMLDSGPSGVTIPHSPQAIPSSFTPPPSPHSTVPTD